VTKHERSYSNNDNTVYVFLRAHITSTRNVMMAMILLAVIIGVDIFVYVVIQLYFEGSSHFKVQGPTKMKKRTKEEIAKAALLASLTSRRTEVIFEPIILTESERMQEELEPIFHTHPTEHDESDDLEMVK